MSKRIFLSPPHMNGTEMALVEEAFASNWIAPLGPFVNKFEEDLGTILDRHVCALCSGTSALHLGLLTLGVGPGDRVYCSDFTFSASCNVIRYCGAEPVFIDSELDSWQMDPALLEQKLEADAKLGKLPKAVVVVDLYGISADFGRILPILAKYDIPLLEDSAEALGSKRDGKLCGTFGKVSGFSFNGNKIITTSGGGALVSDDEAIVKRARYLATQAREPKPFYHHVTIGYNYRLSNILAAIGCGQLNDLEQRVEKRRQIFEQYVCELSDIDGIGFMTADAIAQRVASCPNPKARSRTNGSASSPSIQTSFTNRPKTCDRPWKPKTSRPDGHGNPCTCSQSMKTASSSAAASVKASSTKPCACPQEARCQGMNRAASARASERCSSTNSRHAPRTSRRMTAGIGASQCKDVPWNVSRKTRGAAALIP